MHKKLISFGIGILAIYPLLILPSCATKHNQALRSELSGRGMVNLDLSNPYLAPNKFLSEEAKDSETLKGFLSLKGAPELLEFSEPLIGTTSLKLVYKTKNESYLLEEKGKEWIISGPSKLDKNAEAENKSSLLSDPSPALLPAKEKENEAGTEPKLPADQQSKTEPTEGIKPKSGVPTFKDIYHSVDFEGQTISFVAYWYTGSIMNGDRLRRINSSLSEKLKKGDIVRVPSYLAQKDNQPSEEDFQKFVGTGGK